MPTDFWQVPGRVCQRMSAILAEPGIPAGRSDRRGPAAASGPAGPVRAKDARFRSDFVVFFWRKRKSVLHLPSSTPGSPKGRAAQSEKPYVSMIHKVFSFSGNTNQSNGKPIFRSDSRKGQEIGRDSAVRFVSHYPAMQSSCAAYAAPCGRGAFSVVPVRKKPARFTGSDVYAAIRPAQSERPPRVFGAASPIVATGTGAISRSGTAPHGPG